MAVTAALADSTFRTGTASIASVPIGTAAAGRVVFAFAEAFDPGGFAFQYPLTIGGITTSRQTARTCAAVVPTGTTATFASPSSSSMAVGGVYALSGSPNVRPSGVYYKACADTTTTQSLSVTFPVKAGSTVIAKAGNFTSTTAPTFSAGVTSDATFTVSGALGYRLGHADQASAGNVTVTSTASELIVYVFDTDGPDWLLVGFTNAVEVSSGSINLSAEPSGTAQDDILVATISARGNAAFSYPSGWAAAATAQNSGNTTSGAGGIASGVLGYAIRGASTPASFNFTRTGGGIAWGRVLCFRSSTAGTPSYDAGSSATAGSSAATVAATAITGAVSNELLVGFSIAGDNSADGMHQLVAATTPVATAMVAFGEADSNFEAIGATFSGETLASGSTGTLTASSISANCRAGLLVALFQPPSGGGGGKTLTADAGSYSISGTAATIKRGRMLPAAAGSYALSGTAATIRKNKPVVAGAGSYSLTGTAATIKHGWKLAAGAGSYALTGTDATVTKASLKVLSAGAGSYSITGTAASLLHGWKLPAGTGAYSLTGTAAAIKHGYKIPAGAGSYSLTGTAAAIKHGYKLTAGAGSYSLTGTAAGIKHGYKLAAGAGSYALTGSTATIVLGTGKRLAADVGSYTLSGSNASLLWAKYLTAGPASYLFSGTDIELVFGVAAGTWVPVTKQAETWTRKSEPSSTWTEVTKTDETWTRIN